MRRRQWHPTPVLLPGKSHGWRSLVGCMQSMGSRRVQHDWATSLSCIGEGNGNPFQCSCLESPRDSRAWWAAVYGVAQSRTQLKGLSSSSIALWDQFETYTKFSSKLRFLILKKKKKKQNLTNLPDSSYWKVELLKPTDFLQLLCPAERYNPLLPFPLCQGLKGKECAWGVETLCSSPAWSQQRY